MNSSAPSHLPLLFTFVSALFLAGQPATRAEEPAAPAPPSTPARARTDSDEPLVIANGKFTRDGQSKPATVKNLVELVRLRYPDANITAVGVDDIVIDQLTLHWARYRDAPSLGEISMRVNPPLKAVLTTLSAAAGRKFVPTMFSEKDVLLEVPEGLRGSSGSVVEVFNLSPFLTRGSRRTANVEEQLRNLQLELAVLSKRYADKHPSVVDLTNRIDLVKAQIAELGRSKAEVNQAASDLLGQIDQVVRSTLARQKAGEKPPEFQFHSGSNLLVVTGSDSAVNVTRKVIAALEKNY